MQDFPSNSQKAKETVTPREKLRPVTTAETRGRKQGLGRKFREAFFSGTGRDVVEHSVTDVVVPTIRNLVRDLVHEGIDRLIDGDRGSRPRNNTPWFNQSTGPRVAYDQHYVSPQAQPPQSRTISRQARARHDLRDLVIPTRREAEEVIDQMFDLLSDQNVVRVAELYELTGVRSEHTDWKWGWTSLRGARAKGSTRQGGYLLDLPEPQPLER